MYINKITYNLYQSNPNDCTVFSDVYPLGSVGDKRYWFNQFLQQQQSTDNPISGASTLHYKTDEVSGLVEIYGNLARLFMIVNGLEAGESPEISGIDPRGINTPFLNWSDSAFDAHSLIDNGSVGQVVTGIKFSVPKRQTTFAADWDVASVAGNTITGLVAVQAGSFWKVTLNLVVVNIKGSFLGYTEQAVTFTDH